MRLVQAQQPPLPSEPVAAPETDKPAREQTIYIPYAKLRQIFEKEGRGVFVPYDEFQRLWKAAQSAARKIEDYKPPIAALIAEIESEAAGDTIVVLRVYAHEVRPVVLELTRTLL